MSHRSRVTPTVRAVFLAGAAAGLLSGCRAAPESVPPAPPGLEASWAFADCAPWDGAATTIYLAASMPEDPWQATPYPHAWVSIYRPSAEVGGRTYQWDATDKDTAGATWCRAETQCEGGGVGEVRVHSSAGGTAPLTGTVDLRFPSGAQVVGGFRATWIPHEPICG